MHRAMYVNGKIGIQERDLVGAITLRQFHHFRDGACRGKRVEAPAVKHLIRAVMAGVRTAHAGGVS